MSDELRRSLKSRARGRVPSRGRGAGRRRC